MESILLIINKKLHTTLGRHKKKFTGLTINQYTSIPMLGGLEACPPEKF